MTYDRLLPRHTAQQLEDAYASAASLAESGLEFVLAPCLANTGSFTVPLAERALSVTPWHDGRSGDGEFGDATEVVEVMALLDRLHATPAPGRTPQWRTSVSGAFADELSSLLARHWETGPYAVRARQALLGHLDDIARWVSRYHVLAESAFSTEDSWVVTHGEPHTANQLLTHSRLYLVDWESLKLAPRERDLRPLLVAGAVMAHDPAMVEMFDLEWRLDEINEYAAWFAAPHTGTASDEIAFAGLIEELTRPDSSLGR